MYLVQSFHICNHDQIIGKWQSLVGVGDWAEWDKQGELNMKKPEFRIYVAIFEYTRCNLY